MVSIPTTYSNVKKLSILSSVYFHMILRENSNFSLSRIKTFFFLMETLFFLCEVRTELLNNTRVSFSYDELRT
jgi:hypothetical protein